MKKDPNFDKEAYAAERKEEMESITKKLEKGIQDVFESQNFKDYLNFCARLPRYSVNNQILIMLQKPDASMCQSFTGWKELGRTVKKGEKGIRILAPAPFKKTVQRTKKDADGKTVLDANGNPVMENKEITISAFKPVSTFDVSQTEGDDLPELGVHELTASVDGYNRMLDAVLHSSSVPVSFEEISNGAKGFYHLEDDRIVVQKGMSEAQTLKTLLHEMSHQMLHSKSACAEKLSKSQKETEAESVAYVVCQHFGIETADYSFGYVATWSKDKTVSELKSSLDKIRKTAADIIDRIEKELNAVAA